MTAVKRRVAIVALAIVVLAGATVVSRPLWMKWRTRSALEQASSNLCWCMLGRRGGVDDALLAVRAGIIAKPNPPERLWPARCKPWGEAALAAYADAAKWNSSLSALDPNASWSSRAVLEELEPFWARDPDPLVPLPELRSFTLEPNQLVDVVPRDPDHDLDLRIVPDGLEVNDTLRIERDDKLVQALHETPTFPGKPKLRAIDAEPGAKRFWTDGALFFDDTGKALGSEWFTDYVWARSFKDGRLVAHVYVTTPAFESHGEIWEYAPGKKLARVRFERGVPENAKTTTSIDQWMLFKHADETGASLVAMDMSRGVAAAQEPVILGSIERTSRYLGRSRGTCRAHGTFVDMDPHMLIRTKDGWKFARLEQQANRIVSCEGDVAMVTEWIPLQIHKCTEAGCTEVSFPSLSAGPDDSFAADDHHVFQIVRADGAVGVHVYDLDNPANARHVPLLPRAGETRLRVVAGRAILFIQKERFAKQWAIVSVRPDGAAHVITPM